MRNLFIILFVLYPFLSDAQEQDKTDSPSDSQQGLTGLSESIIFPEKCLGVWEGMMYIFSQGSLRDSVKVKFTAAKTDIKGNFVWKTEYLSPTRPMVKDYKLVVDDPVKGRYLLDEGDGVKLRLYNINNKLYSLFKVNDIYLTSSTELFDDRLVFEVTSGKEEGETQGVKNYSFSNVQRVELRRID
ncbi:hypothetical protein LCM02_02805 [Lutimonas saemankumensis]|uniref:hypothetical protein n=1 Tax=Lutimonas saemankumensis TaxID=483016 RepID=UPI001CD35444|nr:hypothetical protein [Lutimonas saemankumensis]MCA0931366.1 hypothetical protein [Lutimonas saemankumensis]